MSAERWVSVGLFAEGSSDYRFLGELLPRLIRDVAHERFGPDFELWEPVIPLDAPGRSRRAKIAAAIDPAWDECTLFVVHADGNGDPHRARAQQIAPGLALAAERHPDLVAVGCVPVREIEAWLLADARPWTSMRHGQTEVQVRLPDDPEAVADPKRVLRQLVTAVGRRRRLEEDIYAQLGRLVSLDALDRLPAARRFRDDLAAALARLAPPA